jgi:lipoyl(octanoyl) transferase
VEALTCRLLPWEIADGPTNMAADDRLVRTAAEAGIASLRFYGWSPATLSLGYFQPAAVRLHDPLLAPLPFVRRPSGGATLVHHREVTYALALPPGTAASGTAWMARMHGIIASALANLDPVSAIHAAKGGETGRHGDVLCFQQFTAGDLLCAGMKVVGSAQRKYRRALLQHGSILLATSPHTPALPGLAELIGRRFPAEIVADAVADTFARETGWRLAPAPWSDAERRLVAELRCDQYATVAWNERR